MYLLIFFIYVPYSLNNCYDYDTKSWITYPCENIVGQAKY